MPRFWVTETVTPNISYTNSSAVMSATINPTNRVVTVSFNACVFVCSCLIYY